MHLPHAGHVQHAEQRAHLDLCPGLFIGFAGCALRGGFVQLHEACGQRPFAPARLNVALAQQHAPIGRGGHGADDVQRVFVVHRVAGGADGAQLGIAIVRQAVHHGVAAVAAVFDGAAVGHAKKFESNRLAALDG